MLIVNLNEQRNLEPFLVNILRYQITIDAKLKFAQFPWKNFLSTTLISQIFRQARAGICNSKKLQFRKISLLLGRLVIVTFMSLKLT